MAMSCAVHTDREALAYCRNCGKAMCNECTRDVRGLIYCEPCLVERVQTQQAAAPAAVPYSAVVEGPSPALAAFLGLIPGVGAIYNGQFAKAFVHVVVFGILTSLASRGNIQGWQPLFGILSFFFVFYMAGDAYHTAKRRRMGLPVDEWSGLMARDSRMQGTAGALVLIVIGAVFLLDNLNLLRIDQVIRFWPVLLIAIGALMLYQRVGGRAARSDDFSISRSDRL